MLNRLLAKAAPLGRRLLPSLGLVLAAAGSAGCYDVDASFDDFEKRYTALPPYDAGPSDADTSSCMLATACTRTEGTSKPYLLTVSTAINPMAPSTVRAQVTLIEGGNAMTLEVQSYDYRDRTTLIGDITTIDRVPINPDGTFASDPTPLDIDANANAALPGTAAKVNIALSGGLICDDTIFACGDISGDIVEPVAGPLTGTWTARLIENDVIPEPTLDCACNMAPPL